ncbi:hypothetical protein BU15DRAFT_63930 [Melanogaster broomeanus]|nr:hypothetical protein BU15DRAFT_63930 [Melanogaster broomeanus]
MAKEDKHTSGQDDAEQSTHTLSYNQKLKADLDVATLLQVDEGEVLQRGHSSSSPGSPFAVHMDPSPLPPPTNLKLPSTPLITSHVLNAAGQVSIVKMIETRRRFQSGTNTKSELVIRLNPKFALRHVHDTEEKEKDGVTADVQDERDPSQGDNQKSSLRRLHTMFAFVKLLTLVAKPNPRRQGTAVAASSKDAGEGTPSYFD